MFTLFDHDSLFWFCALAGSGLCLIQFLLSIFGADDDLGKFKWMSKQAVIGFLMMFGWVGLTCKKELDCSGIESAGFGLIGGIVAILMTGFIFKMAAKLKSSGTVFNIEETLGKQATVYQSIPKGGCGKVTVSLHDFTHELEAISTHEEDIPSFIEVQITKIENATTVVVSPIQ